MSSLFPVRVAAYAVIVRDDEVLLSHWWHSEHAQGWALPGGGLDLGETPEQAVLREITEETGYTAELEGYLGSDVTVFPPAEVQNPDVPPGQPLEALRLIYRARITGGDLAVEVDGSSDDARWFPFAEVPRLHQVSVVRRALAMAGLGAGR